MDRFVYAHSQPRETTLQCNVVSHWLGAFTKLFLLEGWISLVKRVFWYQYPWQLLNSNPCVHLFVCESIVTGTLAILRQFETRWCLLFHSNINDGEFYITSIPICIWHHYSDVIMGANASQITSLTIVYSTVYSGPDQRKHQSSASLAFVWRIHRGPVNSPHKWPVTRKMFRFDDVIMITVCHVCCALLWFVTGRLYPYPSGSRKIIYT